jgi:murein DD-endopeptidase MepM/ murein hydrolase activator NlpD
MEKLKNLLARLKKNLDLTIMIVPNNGTKIRRFHIDKFLTACFFYTFAVLAIGIYSAGLFSAVDYTTMSGEDITRINQLNERIISLTVELEGLKESNRNLRSAILLADSGAFGKSVSPPVKRIKKTNSEGNIYKIFNKFLENFKEIQQESYYFIKPAEGFISRGFNPEKGHFGIDIVLKTGNPVYSAGNGYVVYSDYSPEDGYMIIINHSDEFVTLYKHCSATLKRARENIRQGEIIALSGNTGESTGPHLHFEIWKKGVPQDPKEYLFNN